MFNLFFWPWRNRISAPQLLWGTCFHPVLPKFDPLHHLLLWLGWIFPKTSSVDIQLKVNKMGGAFSVRILWPSHAKSHYEVWTIPLFHCRACPRQTMSSALMHGICTVSATLVDGEDSFSSPSVSTGQWSGILCRKGLIPSIFRDHRQKGNSLF